MQIMILYGGQLLLPCVVERMSQSVDIARDAAREDRFRGTFRNEELLPIVCGEHRQASALEIKRYLGHSGPAINAVALCRHDRIIKGTSDATLESAVQINEVQDSV